MLLDFCLFRVLFTIPTVVELSMWMGVGGCGWPNSSSVSRSIFASFAFKNNAPNSASAAEAATNRRTVLTTRTAPLRKIGLLGFVRVFHYHDHYQKKTTKSHHSHIILSHLYLRKNWRQISRFRFRNDNDKYSDRPSCVFLLQISKNPNLFVSISVCAIIEGCTSSGAVFMLMNR